MAKCIDCTCSFATFGGSKGSKCPICRSENLDVSMEIPHTYDSLIKARQEAREEKEMMFS